MRPFNEGEKREIAEFTPKLDAMPDAKKRVMRHIGVLVEDIRSYRASDLSCWPEDYQRTRAISAVKTIRAYRWIAEQKGWTL